MKVRRVLFVEEPVRIIMLFRVSKRINCDIKNQFSWITPSSLQVFVVLCMSLALAASAAIEQQAEAATEQKAAEEPKAAAAGEKKHGKRGLFDLGYGYGGGLYNGFDAYGWGGPDFGVSRTVTLTKHVAVPHPVIVEKPVHYPVKVPVAVPVEKHVPVYIDRKVPVYVEKHIPVHIDRPVPYPVKVPVKVPVLHKVHVPVPKPYPVHVPHPVIVEKHVPHLISHDSFGFGGGHHFSNGWVGHHGYGHGLSHSYSDFSLHH